MTQSFNTTTSMGRLTLNVLLSFAQFEREVTGERIRDKIAASKKKGMWMGGVVPLGYRVEDRALHIVEEHAAIVRSLFRRYLEAGSVVRLKQSLDAEGFADSRFASTAQAGRPAAACSAGGTSTRSCRTRSMSAASPIRAKSTKASIRRSSIRTFGIGFSKACAIIWRAARTKRTRQSSEALLAGKLFDDRGNRMSPTWARKGSKRWRYYVSQAALQGDKSKAGSIVRVPAAEVEALVTEAVGKLSARPRRFANRHSRP